MQELEPRLRSYSAQQDMKTRNSTIESPDWTDENWVRCSRRFSAITPIYIDMNTVDTYSVLGQTFLNTPRLFVRPFGVPVLLLSLASARRALASPYGNSPRTAIGLQDVRLVTARKRFCMGRGTACVPAARRRVESLNTTALRRGSVTTATAALAGLPEEPGKRAAVWIMKVLACKV